MSEPVNRKSVPATLNEVVDRTIEEFEELERRVADPAVLAQPATYRALARQHGQMSRRAHLCRGIRDVRRTLEETRALAASEPDASLREMAAQELPALEARWADLRKSLKRDLASGEAAGPRDAILEIRPGTGGEEASLFAGDLLRMYERHCERRGWKFERMQEYRTELGGVREAVAAVQGEGAFARLRYESGVHRVQRVPATEASGRIHTSAATVAVLPEAEEIDVEIRPEDLRIETYRAGGKGGQHVNKTESAVRITHIPTGIVVAIQDERSQHKNRDKADRILRARIYEQRTQALKSVRDSDRKSQIGSGDRSARIRTYNFPQGRVTDHRINLTLHNLPAILDGDLDELHEALLEADDPWKGE